MHKSTDLVQDNPAQVVVGQEFLNKEFGLLDRYEAQAMLVGALETTEFHRHLAEKVYNCHKKFRLKRCENNDTWAKADNSCSVRLCPHCSNRKTKLVGSRVQAFVVGRENLKYMVLAEQNSRNLKAGIDSLYKAWDRLRRSVFWKRRVLGAIAVLEITYNVKLCSWHPHLNVLFEGDYIPFQELNLRWQKATADRGRTSWIQKANENTVYELIKYTLKVAEYQNTSEGRVLQLLFEDPRVLDEFLSAVYGVRLIRSYGVFRSMGDVEAEPETCPDCGSNCIVDLGPVSHQQLSFDFEKEVFRVKASSPRVLEKRFRQAEGFNPFYLTKVIAEQKAQIPLAVEARRRMRAYERSVLTRISRKQVAA